MRFLKLFGLSVIFVLGARGPDPQQAALKEALVKLSVAMNQGIDFTNFATLILDMAPVLHVQNAHLTYGSTAFVGGSTFPF